MVLEYEKFTWGNASKCATEAHLVGRDFSACTTTVAGKREIKIIFGAGETIRTLHNGLQ